MITPQISNIHAGTPTITVFDNRHFTVRTLQYYRQPNIQQDVQERLEFQYFNLYGFLQKNADARLSDYEQYNFYYHTDLIGFPLLSNGVDSGEIYQLNDIEQRLMVSIDANKTFKWRCYEANDSLGRLENVSEKIEGENWRVSERFQYAGNSHTEQLANLAGQCINHFDTAGLLQIQAVSLQGEPTLLTRQFIQQIDNAEFNVDWQGDSDLTALSPEKFSHQIAFDATGVCLSMIDAKGHKQHREYDVAGQLIKAGLTIKDNHTQPTTQCIEYSAVGKKTREEHGNGVVTEYVYEAQTQRLILIQTYRPVGHSLGYKLFQSLHYDYDPVGNVIAIHNSAEKKVFWRNQKVEPKHRYQYDTLYQLVHATGREIAGISQQSHYLPHHSSIDNSIYTRYFRAYSYDKGGNLIQIHHRAPAMQQAYTIKMTTSSRSNHAVLADLAEFPYQVEALFTSSGQQKQLLQGQNLTWTSRQELQSVNVAGGSEFYRYDGDSQRILKITKSNQTQSKVIYLSNLEIRQVDDREKYHVICIGEDGEAQAQVLNWEIGLPDEMVNNTVRYSINGLASNSGLELDMDGSLISQEEFYPFGGTAVWAVRSVLEVNYKTRRYSGQERDITGLYYYGRRYYQPWVGRWLSADPAGTIDGLNLYRMVRNNPLTYRDEYGLAPRLFDTQDDMFADFQQTVSKLLNASSKIERIAKNPSLIRNRVISMAQLFYKDKTSKFTYAINLYEKLEMESQSEEFKTWATNTLNYQDTTSLPSSDWETANHAEQALIRTLTANNRFDLKSLIISQKAKMCSSCENAMYTFRQSTPKSRFTTMILRDGDLPLAVIQHGRSRTRYKNSSYSAGVAVGKTSFTLYDYKGIEFQVGMGSFWGGMDKTLYTIYANEFERVFGNLPIGKGAKKSFPPNPSKRSGGRGHQLDKNQPSTSRRYR
ncbi:RHS repeat-associated core domain-containing protein [Providencia vermicola]|uniref:RHS repeat-associated core domain-containing protein n=1 Tax=Providencia vermicola TaxID=333965 RepID=UPI003D2C3B7B